MLNEIVLYPIHSRDMKAKFLIFPAVAIGTILLVIFSPESRHQFFPWVMLLITCLTSYLFAKKAFFRKIVISDKIYFHTFIGANIDVNPLDIINFEGNIIELKNGIINIKHLSNCDDLYHYIMNEVNTKRDMSMNDIAIGNNK